MDQQTNPQVEPTTEEQKPAMPVEGEAMPEGTPEAAPVSPDVAAPVEGEGATQQ